MVSSSSAIRLASSSSAIRITYFSAKHLASLQPTIFASSAARRLASSLARRLASTSVRRLASSSFSAAFLADQLLQPFGSHPFSCCLRQAASFNVVHADQQPHRDQVSPLDHLAHRRATSHLAVRVVAPLEVRSAAPRAILPRAHSTSSESSRDWRCPVPQLPLHGRLPSIETEPTNHIFGEAN